MMQAFHEEMSAGHGGIAGAALRPALWGASVLYRLAVSVRNRRFDAGAGVIRVDMPVVSVGNLTTGGTGKTPVVIELVSRLLSMGKTPAVVSRGYRAARGEIADELALIQRAHPQVPCVADPDRVAGAQRARVEYGADVIVLDDGFQHRRIHRDLDVVLIDATRPFGGGHVLPRGNLREPVDALSRADLLVITRTDQVDGASLRETRDRLAVLAPEAPQVLSIHRPIPVVTLSGASVEMEPAPSGTVLLVSGIGHHDAFRATAEAAGFTVSGHLRFSDHHPYTPADLAAIDAAARDARAAAVLTTSKDAVKLRTLKAAPTHPVWVLDVGIAFQDGGGAIVDEYLTRAVEGGELHDG